MLWRCICSGLCACTHVYSLVGQHGWKRINMSTGHLDLSPNHFTCLHTHTLVLHIHTHTLPLNFNLVIQGGAKAVRTDGKNKIIKIINSDKCTHTHTITQKFIQTTSLHAHMMISLHTKHSFLSMCSN